MTATDDSPRRIPIARPQLGTALMPLTVGPQLLEYLEQTKRLAFLKQWKEATAKK